MPIDIKTDAVEPIRTTFDHIAERLGEGKTPTRYQEAIFDLQPTLNLHYRPTWDPTHELYDANRTSISMEDWDELTDPRRYYYGTYVMERGRQQDSQEKNFVLVEKRGLLNNLDPKAKERVQSLVVPLRHAEWGANQVNAFIAGYGYGAAVTSAATLQMIDRLGNAQYLSRLGLILGNGGNAVLESAKKEWLEAENWQPLRRLVEDLLVATDWFELHIAQNLILDGVLQPLIFDRFIGNTAMHGGTALTLLTEFTREWFSESQRWTDAIIKRAIMENESNKNYCGRWIDFWKSRTKEAIKPLSLYGFDDEGDSEIDRIFDVLNDRIDKLGFGS